MTRYIYLLKYYFLYRYWQDRFDNSLWDYSYSSKECWIKFNNYLDKYIELKNK